MESNSEKYVPIGVINHHKRIRNKGSTCISYKGLEYLGNITSESKIYKFAIFQ